MHRVMLYLLLRAQNEPMEKSKSCNGRPYRLTRGQVLITYSTAGKDVALSRNGYKKCLTRAVAVYDLVTVTNHGRFSIVTIKDYDDWIRFDTSSAGLVPDYITGTEQTRATPKSDKSVKIEKIEENIIYIPEQAQDNYSYKDFIKDFNKILGRSFRGESKSERQFGARIKEGFQPEEFKAAIANAKQTLENTAFYHNLTPELITRADKLAKYSEMLEVPRPQAPKTFFRQKYEEEQALLQHQTRLAEEAMKAKELRKLQQQNDNIAGDRIHTSN